MNTTIIAPRKRKAIVREYKEKVLKLTGVSGATITKITSMFGGFIYGLQFSGEDNIRVLATQKEAIAAFRIYEKKPKVDVQNITPEGGVITETVV